MVNLQLTLQSLGNLDAMAMDREDFFFHFDSLLFIIVYIINSVMMTIEFAVMIIIVLVITIDVIIVGIHIPLRAIIISVLHRKNINTVA